jgi:hypothetical protein
MGPVRSLSSGTGRALILFLISRWFGPVLRCKWLTGKGNEPCRRLDRCPTLHRLPRSTAEGDRMPWKTRRGRRYYYRSRRQGGRVVSEYVGAGPDAELIAGLEGAWADRRDLARERERDERAGLDAEEAEVERWHRRVEGLLAAALLGCGRSGRRNATWGRPGRSRTPPPGWLGSRPSRRRSYRPGPRSRPHHGPGHRPAPRVRSEPGTPSAARPPGEKRGQGATLSHGIDSWFTRRGATARRATGHDRQPVDLRYRYQLGRLDLRPSDSSPAGVLGIGLVQSSINRGNPPAPLPSAPARGPVRG